MTAAAQALQKAVFSVLAGDEGLVALLGGPRIHDGAPEGTAFPSITFGRTSVYDWSTASEEGTEQIFSLHVWSRARGRREAQGIMERVRERLAGGLEVEGHHLVDLRLEYSETRFDEDAVVQHGLLRFRARLEAAG